MIGRKSGTGCPGYAGCDCRHGRRFVYILLTVCAIIAMMTSAVFAGEGDNLIPGADSQDRYADVYVLGRAVTQENAGDILGDGGSVKYDQTARTLTLTDAVLDLADYQSPAADNNYVAGIIAMREININVNGNNVIVSNTDQYPADKEYVIGINAFADLNVAGNGTLEIAVNTGKTGLTYYGIDSSQKFTADCRAVHVEMNGTEKSTGIDANWNGIEVKGSTSVLVYAGGAGSTAVCDRSFGKTTVAETAKLSMTSEGSAFKYSILGDSMKALGAMVSENPQPDGAAIWDKSTNLSTYKYVSFPSDISDQDGGGRGFWQDSVYVLGRPCSSDNCNDVLGDGGSVKYDHDTRTLTLTDAALDLKDYQNISQENNYIAGISASRGTNIVLNGNNTIWSAGTYGADKEYVYGISNWDEMNISGNGTLAIVIEAASENVRYYGIESNVLLTVDGSAIDVNISGPGKAYGVSATFNGFDLRNRASLNIMVGGNASSYAMYESSFGRSKISWDSALQMSTSDAHAFEYIRLSQEVTDLGAMVSTDGNSDNAVHWDRTTRLTQYKYVRFPETADSVIIPVSIKGRTVTVKYSQLKKKNQTIRLPKAITIKNAEDYVRFAKVSGNKKITINKKTGAITVRKGLKKGSYKLKVKVTVGKSPLSLSKTVTVKIKVK